MKFIYLSSALPTHAHQNALAQPGNHAAPSLKRLLLSTLTGLAFLLGTPCLFANNTIPLGDLLDKNGKIANPLNLTGTVDFAGFHPVMDDREGLVFLPPPVVAGWNALGTGLNAFFYAIAISGSDVYVGGDFTDAGGNANADRIARWDGSSWNALGTGLGATVRAIAISGSNVYAGGEFTDAGGNTSADRIARWDGSSWNALGTGLANAARDLAFSGSDLYVSGDFDIAGGVANTLNIARWNGSTWNALGTGLNGDVASLAVSGSDVYVSGYFSNAGGDANADFFARWNGSSWNALGSTPLNNVASALTISGSDVYAGGHFTDAGGNPNADFIARWDGSTWNALGTTPLNASVWAVAISGSDVYVGGDFSNAGGNASADRIARWDGSSWNALDLGLNNRVEAIAISGSDLYVGGNFTNAGGNADADRIARFEGIPCTPSAFSVCPGNQSVNVVATTCAAPVSYTATATGTPELTITYSFSGVTTGSGSGTGSGSSFNVGTTTVTLTASSTCTPAAATCTFTVTVSDNEKPTLPGCPSNILLKTSDDGSADCAVTLTYTAPTSADNCDGTGTATWVSGPTSGTSLNVSGSPYTVVYTKTDAAGNSVATNCSFTITVADDDNPSIVCPGNITKNTDPSLCTAIVNYSNPTTSDNCGSPTLTRTSAANTASGSAFPLGVTMVNWKATDSSNNSAVCDFTVTVLDAQLPTITCPSNIVRSTDAGQCYATVSYTAPTATDNCAGVTVMRTAGLASGSAFPKGPSTVTYEASDAATPPNKKSCSFTVTVNDNQLPTITCPANQTKGTDLNLCTAVATYTNPTATDNCSSPPPTVTIVSGLPSGQPFPKGITTVQWKATDGAGLTKTCTFRITVNDTQVPTVACPSSQSLNTGANLCTAAATYTNATFTDNCAGGSVVRTSGIASGSAFPKGVSTVVFKATDAVGLTKTCSFTVTVTDNQLPSISCPPNISATAAPGQCNATVNYATPTASDNCTVQSTFLLSGLGSGSLFPAGVTTVVWRAIDNSGGSSTCAFTVTVSCGAAPSSAKASAGKSEQGGVSREHLAAEGSTIPKKLELSNLGLRLAPNPAATEVQIWLEYTVTEALDSSALETLASKQAVTMFDALGRMVWQQSLAAGQTQTTIDLSRFEPGAYWVSWQSESSVLTKRLIVQE